LPLPAVFLSASCRRPVLITNAPFEKPAATWMVVAGSVVLCGRAPSGADACCVAFCVAL
jgi:hypothetical protein